MTEYPIARALRRRPRHPHLRRHDRDHEERRRRSRSGCSRAHGSSSPRPRRRGWRRCVAPASTPRSSSAASTSDAITRRPTPRDARAGAGRRSRRAPSRPASTATALVLGCDSMLEFDGEALGKPVTRRGRGRALAGDARTHRDAAHRALPDRHGAARRSRDGRRRRCTSPTSPTTRSSATSRTGEPSRWPARSPSTGSAAGSSSRSTATTTTSSGVSLPLLRRWCARGHGLSRPRLPDPTARPFLEWSLMQRVVDRVFGGGFGVVAAGGCGPGGGAVGVAVRVASRRVV